MEHKLHTEEQETINTRFFIPCVNDTGFPNITIVIITFAIKQPLRRKK